MTKTKVPLQRTYDLTDSGRERIIKAQKRRWRLWRKAKREAKATATRTKAGK
jgi:hypothetical protein